MEVRKKMNMVWELICSSVRMVLILDGNVIVVLVNNCDIKIVIGLN